MMLTEATSPDLAAMDAVPCLRDNIDEEDGEVVVTVGVIVVVDNSESLFCSIASDVE